MTERQRASNRKPRRLLKSRTTEFFLTLIAITNEATAACTSRLPYDNVLVNPAAMGDLDSGEFGDTITLALDPAKSTFELDTPRQGLLTPEFSIDSGETWSTDALTCLEGPTVNNLKVTFTRPDGHDKAHCPVDEAWAKIIPFDPGQTAILWNSAVKDEEIDQNWSVTVSSDKIDLFKFQIEVDDPRHPDTELLTPEPPDLALETALTTPKEPEEVKPLPLEPPWGIL